MIEKNYDAILLQNPLIYSMDQLMLDYLEQIDAVLEIGTGSSLFTEELAKQKKVVNPKYNKNN